ncbi:ankyrin repeat-containing domain protein [Aspergillus leporis]|uniref:Ankyrin repeat-containing domain protein n=1 Tax=Aspergillus leporis TaxID=41062 RepID=A0A5N5XEY2_9EURO|nr:ankyrin repeat-containing domain protein [Aspergillus leporis]
MWCRCCCMPEQTSMLRVAGSAIHCRPLLTAAPAKWSGCFLDAKADVSAQGGEYGNALQAASYAGNSQLVWILLAANADVNARGGQYGTAFLAAVNKGHSEVIQTLLDAGAIPPLLDHLDRTPLHIIASSGALRLFHQFPVFSVFINVQDIFSQTPLHLALYHSHVELAIALLKAGSDPRLRDGFGRNAMDWAVGHDTLVHQMRQVYPAIGLTPEDTQIMVVRQSVAPPVGHASPIQSRCKCITPYIPPIRSLPIVLRRPRYCLLHFWLLPSHVQCGLFPWTRHYL